MGAPFMRCRVTSTSPPPLAATSSFSREQSWFVDGGEILDDLMVLFPTAPLAPKMEAPALTVTLSPDGGPSSPRSEPDQTHPVDDISTRFRTRPPSVSCASTLTCRAGDEAPGPPLPGMCYVKLVWSLAAGSRTSTRFALSNKTFRGAACSGHRRRKASSVPAPWQPGPRPEPVAAVGAHAGGSCPDAAAGSLACVVLITERSVQPGAPLTCPRTCWGQIGQMAIRQSRRG